MKTFSKTLSTACAALLLCWFAPAALAQGDAFSKQEKARLEFGRLQEAMQRLQVALSETAPDESRVLRTGNKFIQEKRIRERMADVRSMLKDARWDEALEGMSGVRDDLDILMNVLMNRDLDLKELLEEIARLEAFKKRVKELIEEQQAEKEDAARSEALQKHLEELDKAKAEIDRLMAEQSELRDRANESGLSAAENAAKGMAAQEGDLKEKAKSLADKLQDLEKDHDEIAEQDGNKPKDAEQGKPKDQPAKDGKGGKPADGASAGACSGSCQSASQSMGKAQQKLSKNAPERSLEDMDKAMEALAKAKKALEQMTEEARRNLMQLPFEEQARKQEVTRIKTDKLAQEMENSGQEDGEAKEQTPGTQAVQQAVPKQKAAAGQLKEYKPSKAKQDQQDAKEDLEEAQKQLEDALAQLRQQLQDEILRALEERFGAMLAQQKEISARTVVTDRLRGEALTTDGALPAALVARCRELADGENELASEAGDALKLLEEEGTTAVFPEIVIELKDDLERVATRLGDNKTGTGTRNMQAEIENTLKMLIDALRRTIEDGEGKCGQCNGEPPLVPLSAELKLILALQKRVAKRTKSYDDKVPAKQRQSEQNRTEAGEIARKQGRVRDLTRKLAVKQNKENQAAEGR